MDFQRLSTYIVMALIFFLGAVEYAVILPTLYLYLQHNFQAESYFLGIVLSAFSLMGMVSSPICGWLSDYTQRTKLIIFNSLLFEIIGNILYVIGISKWVILSSRLIAGISCGAEAVIMAELSRSTRVEKRTGIISLFIALRQIGILIGPAFNFFLRLFDFYIGPFHVDNYSSAGLFMAIMWFLLEIIVLIFYRGLPMDPSLVSPHENSSDNNKDNISNEKLCNEIVKNVDYGTLAHKNLINDNFESPSTNQNDHTNGSIKSTNIENVRSDIFKKPMSVGSGEWHDSQSEGSHYSFYSVSEDSFSEPDMKFDGQTANYLTSKKVDNSPRNDISPINSDGFGGDCQISPITSEDIDNIARHEFPTICADDGNCWTVSVANTSRIQQDTILEVPENCSEHVTSENSSLHSSRDDKVSNAVDDISRNKKPSLSRSISNSLQHIAVPTFDALSFALTGENSENKGRFYKYNLFLHEEVIVLLTVQYIIIFNQIALETIITPLTNNVFGWDVVGNSVLYSCAAAEMIIVFLVVRWLSRRIQDRNMILFGLIVLTLTTAYLMWAILTDAQYSYTVNVVRFAIGIFLDMLALPFAWVCCVSLYSKKVHVDVQGLAHGVRRTVSGLAAIMGPLWAGSTIQNPFLFFSVMIALDCFGLMLMFLSFRKLNVTGSVADGDEERSPLLNGSQDTADKC